VNFTYNIYKRLTGDNLAWVERFHELEEATKHVADLQSTSPGNYLIYDVRLRTIVRDWTT
jgi:hypothetical protein